MVELTQLVDYADELLSARDFSDYCPNGLQVEGRAKVSRIVAGVTASQALLEQAIEAGADLVLVHHGYFWKGEDPRLVGMKARRLATLLGAGVSLLAYHLPLDAHPEYGNNVQLAKRLGLTVEGAFDTGGGLALGLHGRPARPLSAAEFSTVIETALKRAPLHVPGGAEPIRRVAWCTGAAQGFIERAAAEGVDAYVSGEISEPTAHVARELGLHYFAAGHHATERYGVQALGEHLAARFGLDYRFIDVPNPA